MASDPIQNKAPNACSRCHEQKLRCSRELPFCARCSRLSANCSYPDPPDRKWIARNRAPRRKKVHQNDATKDTSSNIPSGYRSQDQVSGFSETQHTLATPILDSITNPQDFLDTVATKPIRRLLEDIFFTYIFNATLTLHQDRFLNAQETGKLPFFLSLSLYALAANFLAPPCDLVRQCGLDLHSLGDTTALGQRWAETAGRECLQNIDRPSLAHVQTCQILGMYWFSRGESSRNSIFTGIALRATRNMMMHLSENDSLDQLDKETTRRCFWAAFTTNAVNSDHYVCGTSCDSLALEVPLPSSDASFAYDIREPAITLADLDNVQVSPAEGGEPNVWARIIHLILHWSKIRDLIHLMRKTSANHVIEQFLALEDWLTEFHKRVLQALKPPQNNVESRATERYNLSLFLLHFVYHQERLVLHASIVRQFSGQEIPKNMSPSLVKPSAQIVVESAKAISGLAADLLLLNIDVARLSPFTGHCMYMAASVHLSLLFKNNDNGLQAWTDIIPVLRVLKGMSPYWCVLQSLWSRVQILFESQIVQTDSSSLSDAFSDGAVDNSVESHAHARRSDNGLKEPLAMSLLQYSVSKMRSTAHPHPSSFVIQQLEALITPATSPQVAVDLNDLAHFDDLASAQSDIDGAMPTLSSQQHLHDIHATVETTSQLMPDPTNSTPNINYWTLDPAVFDTSLMSYMNYSDGLNAL